jgi:hypothetical protein
MTFIEPKGPPELVAILPQEPPWLVWITRVILAGLLAGVCQFVSRPMLRKFWRLRDTTPDAAVGAAPERETVTFSWGFILLFQVIGGLAVSGLMVAAPDGNDWGQVSLVLLAVGIFGTVATAMSVVILKGLARRGAWIPPGTAEHPVRVAITMTVLVMTAVAVVNLALLSVVRLLS